MAVIAGPGTGKTGTLVERAAWLVERRGVPPAEITAVTFTNQAAEAMRRRLEERLGARYPVADMTIGTFHAICLKLLGDVRLIGRGDALTAAGEVLRLWERKGSAKALLQGVSRVKNGVPLEQAGLDRELYEGYCGRLAELGALDFDDLLLQGLRLDGAERPCFRHLLVDEFQDINDVQYHLVQAWSRGGESLFVIGDPDQSIYGFRGAGGQSFPRLLAERPEARVIRLTENYRSSPQILEAAAPVISCNPGRPRCLSPNRPAGPRVRLVRAADDFGEGVFLAKEIGRMTGGIDMVEAQKLGHERELRAFSDIAVLCRTRRQLELVEKCLRHDDIPCVVSGREDFLEDDGVRGALAFLRTLQAPGDRAALETALRLLWSCPADLIQRLQRACGTVEKLDPAALADTVRGYGVLEGWLERARAWLPRMEGERPWKLIRRWQEQYGASPALERLQNTAVFYDSFPQLWEALILGQEADLRRASGQGWESGAVRLMTLHAAKGLEFPAVFVAGVREGVLPLERPGERCDVEEERRLLYVGMTRAREERPCQPVPGAQIAPEEDRLGEGRGHLTQGHAQDDGPHRLLRGGGDGGPHQGQHQHRPEDLLDELRHRCGAHPAGAVKVVFLEVFHPRQHQAGHQKHQPQPGAGIPQQVDRHPVREQQQQPARDQGQQQKELHRLAPHLVDNPLVPQGLVPGGQVGDPRGEPHRSQREQHRVHRQDQLVQPQNLCPRQPGQKDPIDKTHHLGQDPRQGQHRHTAHRLTSCSPHGMFSPGKT